MSFCRKCGTFVKRTVAGACIVCGVAVGSPAFAAQLHGGGAATPISYVTPGQPTISAGLYLSRGADDPADPPHGPEPNPTFDGPEWDYSSTAVTVRYTTPVPHDD